MLAVRGTATTPSPSCSPPHEPYPAVHNAARGTAPLVRGMPNPKNCVWGSVNIKVGPLVAHSGSALHSSTAGCALHPKCSLLLSLKHRWLCPHAHQGWAVDCVLWQPPALQHRSAPPQVLSAVHTWAGKPPCCPMLASRYSSTGNGPGARPSVPLVGQCMFDLTAC